MGTRSARPILGRQQKGKFGNVRRCTRLHLSAQYFDYITEKRRGKLRQAHAQEIK